MDIWHFWDGVGVAIVLGGTLLATFLRSGARDCGLTFRALASLLRPPFDMLEARSQIAAQVRRIGREGIRRVDPVPCRDPELADASDALALRGDVAAAMAAHDRHARQRDRARMAALSTLMQMAELAPVFGLAGTLLALARLPAEGLAADALLGAVSTAVLSTLYGLLLAHLLVMPLARMIERRGETDEAAREELMDWLRLQVEGRARLHSVDPDRAA